MAVHCPEPTPSSRSNSTIHPISFAIKAALTLHRIVHGLWRAWHVRHGGELGTKTKREATRTDRNNIQLTRNLRQNRPEPDFSFVIENFDFRDGCADAKNERNVLRHRRLRRKPSPTPTRI